MIDIVPFAELMHFSKDLCDEATAAIPVGGGFCPLCPFCPHGTIVSYQNNTKAISGTIHPEAAVASPFPVKLYLLIVHATTGRT